MNDFVSLTCPKCGGKLQVTKDIEMFACGYCGTEHIVKRGNGIITLKPVLDSIQKVQQGVDKTSSELAIARLTEEVQDIEGQIAKMQALDSGQLTFSILKGLGIGFIFMLIVIAIGAKVLNTEEGIMSIAVIPILVFPLLMLAYDAYKISEQRSVEIDKLNCIKESKEEELLKHKIIVAQ